MKVTFFIKHQKLVNTKNGTWRYQYTVGDVFIKNIIQKKFTVSIIP